MPGRPKVWAYSEVLGGGSHALCLPPSLCCRDLRLMTQGWGLTSSMCLGDTCGHPAWVCAGGHCLSTQIRTQFGCTILWTRWGDMDVAHEGSLCAWQWSFAHTCVGVNV